MQRLVPEPTSIAEYETSCKQDPRLPRSPYKKYKDAGWSCWEAFLGKEKRDLYETYEEAQEAVQRLVPVPTSQCQYFECHKQDPGLPSSPYIKYKEKGWTNWTDYLSLSVGTYKNLVDFLKQNSSSTIRRTGDVIKLIKDKQNPTMRATYRAAIKGELEGYYDFANLIGKEYEDPLTAIKCVKDLFPNLSTKSEYLQLCQYYRALPNDPVSTYGFDTFESFLSFDESMLFNKKQAVDFCFDYKIRTVEEYIQFAKNTPQLPLNPRDIEGVSNFTQIRHLPSYFSGIFESDNNDWIKLAEQYCATGRNAPSRKDLIKKFFVHFKDTLDMNLRAQFSDNAKLINPTDWFDNLPDSKRNEHSLKLIEKFLNYIIEERFTATDKVTGESIVLEGIRNPLNLKSLPIEFIETRSNETNKPALPFKYIQKARDFIAYDHVESIGDIYKRITSQSTYFDTYQDWFDVKESQIDKDDENCIWREKGGVYQMWSPVKIIATLLQLYKPFRGSQIAWLDSGEADKYKLTLKDRKPIWKDNELLAEYRVPVKQWQGFLKPESFGQVTSPVSCHINSNKTSRTSAKGYDIPWIDERVLPFIVQLRDWQEKYNPLTKPIKWSIADLQNSSAKSELKKMGYKGRACFLMRNPCSGDGQSPIKQNMIGKTLRGILHLIEDDEFKLTALNDGANLDENGKASTLSGITTKFTLHSMRVSLITAYIVDAKIAPEIVQKLVGHASIVMTIYYTKVEAETIKASISGLEDLIVKNQTERVAQMIRQQEIDKLESELIDAQGRVKKSRLHQQPVMNVMMDHGICPNGQTQCEDAKRHGYLGAQNCLSCPHLLTGPAFLGGLQMLVNEISLECKMAATRIEEFREKIDVIEHEQYEAKKRNEPYSTHKLMTLESTYQQEVTRFDALTIDMITAVRLSQESINLLNDAKSNESTQLITQLDNGEGRIELNEVSHYVQLDTICQSAEFFQSSRPDFASPRRTQLIDIFARKNGIEPGLFALTPEQQVTVGNQITKLLLARLGSYEKLSQVMEKESTITLKDLGISDTDTTKKELTFLMSPDTHHALYDKETPHGLGVQND